MRYLQSTLKGGAVLGPRLAVIVDAGSGDVGVAEPLLDLGDVGLIIERIGGGRRPQRVSAYLEAEVGRVAAHNLGMASGEIAFSRRPVRLFLTGRNKRAVLVAAMLGRLAL